MDAGSIPASVTINKGVDDVKNGIDISKHNGNIDFQKVKAAGYDFVIIRAGIGISTPKDPMFEANYAKAKAVGLNVGAFWFLRSLTPADARQEARTFISVLNGKMFEYPVYLDLENDPNYGYYPLKTGKENCSAMVKAFCEEVEKAGYFVGLYTSKSVLDTLIDDSVKSKFTIWCAQWASKCTYTGNYGIWQKSETGRVSGINGNVDLDESYQDFPATIKSLGKNGFPKSNSATIKYKWQVTVDVDNEDDGKILTKMLKSAKLKKVIVTSG